MADDTASTLLREANSLRDKGRWLDAADVYAALLLQRPDDAGIMAERAHCLESAGQTEAALRLYREADLLARDGAPALRLGHALLRLGRAAEAEAAFARAIALSPGKDVPWREWQAVAKPADSASGLALDISAWVTALLAGDIRPSHRLESDIAFGALLAETPPVLCTLATEGSDWRALPAGLFLRLDQLQRAGTGPADPDWLEALGMLRAAMAGPPLPFAHGTTLLSPGEVWALEEHAPALRRAREVAGLRFISLLTDATSLAAPETLPPEAADGQLRWLANLPWHADSVLLASASVGRGLGGMPMPPAAITRLDGAQRPAPPGPAPLLPRPLRQGRPYVLCVAPLDAAHDHRLVFGAWLEWLRRRDAASVPDLVCTGAPGWGAEAALALLDNAPTLRGKVHLLPGASEAMLDALYRQCLFTLHNGGPARWSGAVTDSLAHGKPVLMPAPGDQPPGGGLLHFEAGSEPSLLAALEALSSDPAALEQARVATVPLRPWADVAADIMAEAGRLAAEAGPTPPLPLRPGYRTPLRRLRHRHQHSAMAVAETARAGTQWHALEEWGVWSRPGAARLSLPLGEGMAGALHLELDLRGPPQDQAVALQARRKGGKALPAIEVVLPAGTERTVTLAVPPGDGAVEVLLDCARAVPLPEERRVGIGLRALCVARDDSMEDRLAMLESRRFKVVEALPRG